MTSLGNETSTATPGSDVGPGIVADEWDMSFVLGGPAAIAEVQQNAFDVVVTDMRMPMVDGAESTWFTLRTDGKQQLAHTRELLKL